MQHRTPAKAPTSWLLPALLAVLPGCAAIEGIFKAGVWVGFVGVAIVLAGAFGLVRLLGR